MQEVGDHPFLLGLKQVFTNELSIYFVMPFIDGPTLQQVIDKEGLLSEEIVRFYMV